MIENAHWSDLKSKRLKRIRGVSFKEIIKGKIIDEILNPTRENQRIFIIEYKQYVWAIPFVIQEDGSIFLKTIYPSRKLTRRYKGDLYEKD